MKKILYTAGLILLMTGVFSSCRLKEYNPNSLSEDDVLRNYEGWKAYQSNCYTGLWGSLIGLQYGIQSEAGTDLWTFPANVHNQYRDMLAYEDMTVNSGTVRNTWDFAWGYIKDCNKTIDIASLVTNGNTDDKNVLIAETRLLRAYYYSVLVTQFGRIPLITTYSAVTELNPKRAGIDTIYSQIVSDLRFAFNNLRVTPMDNNPQRVTKKTALGLLARVYAQGGGEGLMEGSKSYWLRAKEVADSLINQSSTYGAMIYNDFAQVFSAANNRNNTEVLFTAYGLNPFSTSYDNFTGAGKPNLYLHYYPGLDGVFGTSDLFKRGASSNTSNGYYGRLNQSFIAPTKYLVNCFNATYDKRWENTFQTAFTNYSAAQAIASLGSGTPTPANITYANAQVTLTAAMCTKYGLNPAFVGQKIYPYVDVDAKNSVPNASWQYIPKVWPKGVTTGAVSSLVSVANANVHPYPLDVDEDRFFVYLSKDPLTTAQKQLRKYVTVNIDDFFDLAADPTGSTYKMVNASNGFTPASLASMFPAMMKFNHNFEGGWLGGNFQQKLGNIMIMRMAEVYLIAAEATLKSGGDGVTAAAYLNQLRKRACRNAADYNVGTGMQLVTASLNDVFDEYARELCGEFNRWAILKRHRAFESRLQTYNRTAFASFVPAKHYNRPIPFTFLSQINNAAEFGTNGY